MIKTNLKFQTVLPALIFSMCILELSCGFSISFHVVWWFYFYFIWSILNISKKLKVNYSVQGVNFYLLFTYSISSLIFILHHFLGAKLYKNSSAEFYNILWWTIFGYILIMQIKKRLVDYTLFITYVKKIVFVGSAISALMGLIKYFNIISGNILSSYYYNENIILGSSLNPDYNVYSLGLSIGALLSIDFYRKLIKRHLKILYIVAILVIILSILLSGSRRGVLIIGFIIFCLMYSNKIIQAREQTNLASIILLPIGLLFFIFNSWDRISEYIISSDLVDPSISRVLTLKEELQGKNERTVRFDWSLDYFSQGNTIEKFFGGGFDYLESMGRSISGELEDNPHNYFLSALLYGGLIGFIFIVLLTIELISSSFKYHRIWYPIVFLIIFFSLTSSNSLFALRLFPSLLFILSIRFKNVVSKK